MSIISQKKKIARAAHFFSNQQKTTLHALFVHFYAVVLNEYNVKLPETFQLHFLWRKCCRVFLFTFFSLPLIFTLVTASISSFSHRRYKFFFVFLLTKLVSFGFISRSISFSVIHVNVDIKIKWKERVGICCSRLFISKRPGSYAIYRRNARVLEKQNFIPSYMKGWTYLRTYPVRTIFSEPKFLGCIDYRTCTHHLGHKVANQASMNNIR